jgi:hypothetical protein
VKILVQIYGIQHYQQCLIDPAKFSAHFDVVGEYFVGFWGDLVEI